MAFIKRAFDIISSLIVLIMLIVPFIVIGIVSAIEQGTPVFLKQKRYGKGGKPFNIYKFRTMRNDAPTMASNDLSESYITKWGHFLRKTSIDELPQLFNVLKGDMSVVGPRPLIIEEDEIHQLRKESGVYAVKPGLTGWAQVNGRDNVTMEEKVAYDKDYVEYMSIGFDIKILFKSVFAVILHKDVRK